MRRCMNVGGLKLPVATSTTPPRIPPSLPHQRIRESDDSRVHPSRDRNKQRPDFRYLLGSMYSLSLGRGTSTPTSSIAGERVAGGARRVAVPRAVLLWENLVALSARPLGAQSSCPAFFLFLYFSKKNYRNIFLVLGFTVLYPYRPAGGRYGPICK